MYLESFDQVIKSLNSLFDTDSSRFLKSYEAFEILQLIDVEKIIESYRDDFVRDKLVSDRHLFLDLTKREVIEKCRSRKM